MSSSLPALGATNTAVLRLVIADGLTPVVAGLVLGMSVGAVLRFAAGRMLRNVPPIDVTLLVVVPLLFLTAGLLACTVPARRATRVGPSVVLRDL
jgi:ABC-type lipoprotein release transport system permease subunit